MSTAQIALPPKLIPVFDGPADVRYSHGGRGSGKTRSFAKMIAVRGYAYGKAGISGQLLCARQYMNSLEDSSLEECKRAIEDEPFLADYYDVGEKYIKSRDGRISFTFAGLDRNIASIKSKGRILVAWVDEAEPVTDTAFSILIPTLREEGEDWNAELWVTWNPARKTAAVEKRFRFASDPMIKGAELNWRDNPKFPARLERERQRAIGTDDYDHVWEGAYGVVAGSILGKWVAKARADGRINDEVSYDPDGAPILISGDLGFRDTASWWFWQPTTGGFRLLAYLGDSGLDADDWIPIIRDKITDMGAQLDCIWLPHDAKAKTFQSKHTSVERFVAAFGAGKVKVVPQSKKLDQISAARAVISRCEFKETQCADGIDGLEGWTFEWNPDLQVFSKHPLHDASSHPSDAFAYGCQVMQQYSPPPKHEDARFPVQGRPDGRMTTTTVDELWLDTPRIAQRY